MHTRTGIAAVIAAMAFAAAGCGGGASTAAPSTTAPAAEATAPAESSPLASLRIRHPDTLAFAAPFTLVAEEGKLSDVAREVDVATWASPDELRALLVNGDAEVAAVPSYVAANLHGRGVDVRVVAVVGWGLLHLIGPDGAAGGWDALRGETVHVPFQGDMPDLVFGFLAEANGLEPGVDLTVEYHAQPFEIVGLLAAGRAEWAVLPEHAATLALGRAQQAGASLGRAMDLQDEWGTTTGSQPRIPQVAVVMPGTLVDERPDVVAAVQRELEAAVAKTVEPSGALLATLAESSGLPAEVVADVLGRLNLEFADGAEAREELERFFGELLERSPGIVGGELPGERFYVARVGVSGVRCGHRARDRLWSAVGVVVLVAAWAAWSATQPEILVPSPGETARAAWRLASDGELTGPLLLTSGRALYGVVVASVLGTTWGLLSARSAALEHIGRPLLSVALTVPPVLLVVVGLVWFGPGAAVVRFVTVVVTLPLLASATAEAARALDRDLLEMVRAFAVPRLHVLRHVVGPAIAGPLLAALTVAIGHALRVAVMAELLAARDGVGNRVALARTNLDTAQLFAWAVIMVALLFAVETVALRPVARRALRWRRADPAAVPA